MTHPMQISAITGVMLKYLIFKNQFIGSICFRLLLILWVIIIVVYICNEELPLFIIAESVLKNELLTLIGINAEFMKPEIYAYRLPQVINPKA